MLSPRTLKTVIDNRSESQTDLNGFICVHFYNVWQEYEALKNIAGGASNFNSPLRKSATFKLLFATTMLRFW